MNNLSAIKQMAAENRIEYCHYTLARFIQQSIPQATELCLWLAVLVNIEINRGNVCLDIASLYKKSQELGWNQNSALQISLHLTTSPIIGAEADAPTAGCCSSKSSTSIAISHNEKYCRQPVGDGAQYATRSALPICS